MLVSLVRRIANCVSQANANGRGNPNLQDANSGISDGARREMLLNPLADAGSDRGGQGTFRYHGAHRSA